MAGQALRGPECPAGKIPPDGMAHDSVPAENWPSRRNLVRPPWLATLCVPAGRLASRAERRVRSAPRHHRLGQDLCRLARRARSFRFRRSGLAREEATGTCQTIGQTRPTQRPLDHAHARPGCRHRPRIAGATGRSRHRLERRPAHRRYRQCRTRTPEPTPAQRADHHAGKPDAAADPRRCPPGLRQPAHAGGGRVARAAGQQAWRATATGAGAAAPLDTGADRLGPVRHPGQPAPRARRTTAPRTGAVDPGAHRQGAQGRHPAATQPRTLSLGRAPGPAHAAAGGRGDRIGHHLAGVHQHPLAVGALVSGDSRCTPGLGRADRAAPRLAGPRGARLGRAGPETGCAEGRGLHVQPGPGGGFPAGRTRAADRLAQGRRPLDAARRAFRSRAGTHLTGDAGAHPQPGSDRSRRGAGGGRRTPDRGPQRPAATAGCAGAASGQHGAGWRFPPRRTLRRSAPGLVLSPAGRRPVAMGAGVRAPRRPFADGLPGLSTRRAGRKRPVESAEQTRGAAPSHEHRHHRQRCQPDGEILGPRRHRAFVGLRRGRFHRAPAAG